MPKRISYQRENAEEGMTLSAPLPATVVYGEWVHCPTCSQRLYELDPEDPFAQCNMCGEVADLTDYMRSRGYEPELVA